MDLSSRFEAMGRTAEALEHLRAYTDIADSLHKAQYSTQLARSEVLFGTATKERRIAEQQQALELAATEQRRRSLQRNAAIGLAGVLAVAILLLWRLARSRRMRMEQERALREQQVDGLLQQQEITAMHAMIEGQEKERDRLASELHGRIGGMLGGVKLQMEALEERMDTGHRERGEQYKKVYDLLVEAVGEVRRISHDMGSVVLARFGLARALRDLCDSVRVSGRLGVEITLHGLEHRMERSVEITVYRIVQELIGNVLKHAGATELSVAVTRAPGRLSVMVSDNGRGFDTTAVPQGIGMDNVRAHAAAIGATVSIDSTPGHGTTVSVEGPVVE